jgi:3-deoxy-D-manno-octulosonic-acid transferase
MRLLLDVVYIIAAVVFLPVLAYQRVVHGKKRGGWAERFGHLPPRDAARPCIWIHAVSLGEANATRRIVAELANRLPDRDIVISTTTDTGYARARQLYPDRYVFRYPLDFSWVVRRTLRAINPAIIILMELEVWPNLVEMATVRGIPVAVVNGRVTEGRSMRRYRKPIVRSVARTMFRRVAWVGAQNETYAGRFRALGVPADRVQVAGMLKWDTAQVADDLPGTAELRRALGLPEGTRPVWVAGQTGPGEEAIVLDAFRRLRERHPSLRLVVVPRKPERFDEVAGLLGDSGFTVLRRREHPNAAPHDGPPPDIVLGDTMGELRTFYCLADVVFVGRTLVPMGGSDVIEVAALAKPIVVGPYVDNFAETVEALRAAGAIHLCDTTADAPDAAAPLAAAVDALLTDRARADTMSRRARQTVVDNQGVTSRTVDVLIELVNRAQH